MSGCPGTFWCLRYTPRVIPGMTRTRVSVAISLPPGTASLLDRFCAATHRNRSEVVQAALLRYLPTLSRDNPEMPVAKHPASPKRVASALEPRASKGPLRSKLVDMLMPNASEDEKAEANRNWFAYLLMLDSITQKREAATKTLRSKRKRRDRRQQGSVAQG